LPAVAEAGFRYSDLLPTGADDTPYRLITAEGLRVEEPDRQQFLKVAPAD
jgi:fumarate hydratase class I